MNDDDWELTIMLMNMRLKCKGLIATVLVGLFVLTGCDDEKTIGYGDLPDAARAFIEEYFPGREARHVQREKEDGSRRYECTLDDGTQLEFDASGAWTEVDCKLGALPAGILPEAVSDHMAAHYPKAVAYKVERQPGGYEVSVSGSLELVYAADGTFVREQQDL